MKKPNKVVYAGINDSGKRIDRVLRQSFPMMLRSNIFRALRKGLITRNNKKALPDVRIEPGDSIEIFFAIPSGTCHAPVRVSDTIQKQTIEPMIVYRDGNVIALNKPYGMLVHGPGSLEQLIFEYWKNDSLASLSFRPGPLHRLDRNTTGIQLFSLSLEGARLFTGFFKKHRMKKIYIGITDNVLSGKQLWEDFLERDRLHKKTVAANAADGKISVTHVVPIVSTGTHTLALFMPKTGRTHQIRSQAAIHGVPLSGDKKYAGSIQPWPYILHAAGIKLSGNEYRLPLLTAPLPESSEKIVCSLFGKQALVECFKTMEKELATSANLP